MCSPLGYSNQEDQFIVLFELFTVLCVLYECDETPKILSTLAVIPVDAVLDVVADSHALEVQPD
jgi:hypothetical protein